jgi:asparagine synthetase B (glutamine-hydrolysing)
MSLPLETYELNAQSIAVNEIEHYLKESLKPRVLDIPCPPKLQSTNCTKLAILFSGGLDCTVLARMAHDLLPAADQIDLLNVAFENPRVVQAAKSILPKRNKQNNAEKSLDSINGQDGLSGLGAGVDDHLTKQNRETSVYESCPDRITGRKALKELRAVCPRRIWRFVEVSHFESFTWLVI